MAKRKTLLGWLDQEQAATRGNRASGALTEARGEEEDSGPITATRGEDRGGRKGVAIGITNPVGRPGQQDLPGTKTRGEEAGTRRRGEDPPGFGKVGK